jgi:hypothetical protein
MVKLQELAPVKDAPRLQAAFASLTSKQQEWLLTRRYFETDTACNDHLHRDKSFAATAKRGSEDFRLCYDTILKGDPTVVDEALVDALVQSNVLKALIEERKILDLDWMDVADVKLGTAKAGAVREAIARVRGTKRVEEHVYRVEDVLKIVEGTYEMLPD